MHTQVKEKRGRPDTHVREAAQLALLRRLSTASGHTSTKTAKASATQSLKGGRGRRREL